MTEQATKRKEEFIKRKKGLRTQADITAQQLTNIYRQLIVLGDEATEHYNQQLIREVNPDVLAALRTIPGGEEVRDYYSFLTHTQIDDSDTSYLQTDDGIINTLLPKPDQMSPIWESFGMSGFSAGVNPQKPIPMTVVNPIKASVVTANVGVNSNDTSASNIVIQKSDVDFTGLQKKLDEAFEKQKNDILQALNFIVIDSNIEKMHQNLKNAVLKVVESMDGMKEAFTQEILQTKEKSAFPAIDETILPAKKETPKEVAEQKSASDLEKFRKAKIGPKFSVDIAEEEQIF